jgi:hypothetical protein
MDGVTAIQLPPLLLEDIIHFWETSWNLSCSSVFVFVFFTQLGFVCFLSSFLFCNVAQVLSLIINKKQQQLQLFCLAINYGYYSESKHENQQIYM